MDSYPGATKINFLGGKAAKGQVINSRGETKVKTRVIDGFVKSPATAAARGMHQRGQKAQTLMRGALKKPAPVNHIQNRHAADPRREIRAKQTVTHAKVDRFGGFASTPKKTDRALKEPLLQGEVISQAAPKPAKTEASAAVMPSMVASASHQRLERMLDAALMRADSHKSDLKYQAAKHFWQRPGFFSRRRWLKLSVLIVAVLGATLFIAWQKVPQLSLKLASMRAHVDASVPSYQPVGYNVNGPAKAIDNAVTIQYASAINKSKVYTVQQQTSNQDSSSLVANSSSPGQQVQTAQSNGVPIVIIQNKAKCVSNGVETTITNQANLSPDELLNIAKGVCA